MEEQTVEPAAMEHRVVFRRRGTYAVFPLLAALSGGRLALAFPSNDADHQDHGFVFDWNVLLSADGGETWTPADGADAATRRDVPFLWPGSGPRERWDRFAAVMPDGSRLAAGAVGWLPWPAARRAEAEARGLQVNRHPAGRDDQIMVAENTLFVQRSRDGGETWERREWQVPGAHRLTGFPRAAVLRDGTVLVPLYDIHDPAQGGHRDRNLLLRSEDGGERWRVTLMGADALTGFGDECALVETSPGRVLAVIRQNRPGYLLQAWSEDAGRSWSQPLRTEVWGYPPHLLRLRDGRILCSYGHRRPPLGIRAVVSEDGGETWGAPLVLRADAETRRRGDAESRDLGYPVSVELAGGAVLTAYYLAKDGVTHVASTRWRVP